MKEKKERKERKKERKERNQPKLKTNDEAPTGF